MIVCIYSVLIVLSTYLGFLYSNSLLVRLLWMAAPLSLFWAFGKERNIIVFEDVQFLQNRLKLSFISSFLSMGRVKSFCVLLMLLCILSFSFSFLGVSKCVSQPSPFCKDLWLPWYTSYIRQGSPLGFFSV